MIIISKRKLIEKLQRKTLTRSPLLKYHFQMSRMSYRRVTVIPDITESHNIKILSKKTLTLPTKNFNIANKKTLT